MANQNDSDLISCLSEILSIDDEEVINKITSTPVDTMLEVIDAVKTGNNDRVVELLKDTGEPESDEKASAESDDLNPILKKSGSSATKTSPDVDQSVEESADEDFYPNTGQEVMVGNKKGVVKIPRGPRETIGVIIDGELTMVARKSVGPLTEGVLGMTMMGDLARMKELAGIKSDEMEIESQPVAAEPVVAEPVAAPVAEVPPAPVQAPAPTPVEPVETDSGCTPYDRIDNAFDSIEEALPDVRFSDVKSIRERLNKLLIKLNESARPRKR